MLGYDVVDPERRRVVNQLGGWPADLSPDGWQTLPTIFEATRDHGIHVASVSLPLFEKSALTRASLRGPKFFAARQTSARARATHEIFAKNRNALVYTYFNELDKAGHKFGVDSSQWRDSSKKSTTSLKR